MPTQEERINILERATTLSQKFQQQAAEHIRETNENTTILLGVIRSQGHDIKRMVERLDTIDQRFNTVETRLDRIESTLGSHTTLLNQILERLPEKS
jgi:small-conductance mechanosensitive channel